MAKSKARTSFRPQSPTRQPSSPTLAATLQHAVTLHQQGRIADAERLYQQILQEDPRQFDALHLLGVIARLRGDPKAAVELIIKSIQIKPDQAVARSNLGSALLDLGRYEEALRSCDRAIGLQPPLPEAHYNRGNALDALGRSEDALASYEQALQLMPGHINARCNQGNVLRRMNRHEAALHSYEQVLQFQPAHVGALNNCGVSLRDLNRLDDALTHYERVLRVAPGDADVLVNLSNVLEDLGRHEEALAFATQALQYRPAFAEAHYGSGNALLGLTRHKEALASYERALQLKPDFEAAHLNEGLCRLASGDYALGWEKYEFRFKAYPELKHDYGLPVWQGESLADKTILLTSEQGFGDGMQFVRYASLVAGLAARVILLVPKPLQRLFSTVNGVAQVISADAALPPCDVTCSMLSLPHRLGTRLDTIPNTIPYLCPDDRDVGLWKARLNSDRSAALRVGLVWAGSGRRESGYSHFVKADARRSLTLSRLAPLANAENIVLYSLQKGDPAAQAKQPPAGMQLIDHTDLLNDFADTAALIMNLDLVITVDTAVAHLAGALGKPVWVLNRFDSCWRWLTDRSDSPWYPTLRLFRQAQPGQWEPVIADVLRALREQSHAMHGRRNIVAERRHDKSVWQPDIRE